MSTGHIWTIDLAKNYHLDLQTQRKKELDWGKLPVSAKMHRFFAGAHWPLYIKAVSASAEGKAGVFFLYKTAPNSTSPNSTSNNSTLSNITLPNSTAPNNPPQLEPSPSYVVKLTNAPQRCLFAEYVLKNFGGAKIPKSLVVSLYWDDYPDDLDTNINLADPATDDGLKLVHLLRQQNLRHSNVTPGSEREQTYQRNLGRLAKNASNRPDYLVIMKGF